MKFSKQFISANDKMCSFDAFEPAPYFRKEFTLDFQPDKAEITICGLGFYELTINGVDITKGPLAPYVSNPGHICYYDAYDIAHLLHEGKNAIGILLGNGFRNCYGGFIWDFDTIPDRGPVTVALCLEAEKGGQKFEMEADESFKTHPSPILWNDMRMGYGYDARLEIPDWDQAGFDDSGWKNAILGKTPSGMAKLCEADPMAVTREVKAVEIKHYDSLCFAHDNYEPLLDYADDDIQPLESTRRENVYVYDFGFGTAGITRIKGNFKPGQKIVVRHADNLVKGEFSVNTTIFLRKHDARTQRYLDYGQTDVFICKGGEEVLTPRFKYDGFRYAYVEGLEEGQATEDAVVCLVTNSDVKERGNFTCSDPVLNQLQFCTRNSDLANFQYFPLDCPHREKNGWTADAWEVTEHMLMNLTVEDSLREWLHNIRLAQKAGGEMPSIIPSAEWGYAGTSCGSGPIWDSIAIMLPYYLYQYTGNQEIIRENAEMMEKLIRYYIPNLGEDGLTHIGLGDWRDPFSCPENNWAAQCPVEVVTSLSLYDAVKKGAFLMAQIGDEERETFFQTFADTLRENIRKHLVDLDTMTVKGNCQTSQTIGIAFGIFDETEMPKAKEKLLEIIHRDGDINACGGTGLRFIYRVLAEMGEHDLAHKLITGDTFSCYGYWVKEGATTLWESFRNPYSRRCDSRNHPFLGDISAWFIQSIAGIQPNPHADDIQYFEIAPGFVKALTWAKGYYTSPLGGTISVHWERCDEKIQLSVSVPDGMYGKLILPKGYAFSDGTKEYTFDGKEEKKFIIV